MNILDEIDEKLSDALFHLHENHEEKASSILAEAMLQIESIAPINERWLLVSARRLGLPIRIEKCQSIVKTIRLRWQPKDAA